MKNNITVHKNSSLIVLLILILSYTCMYSQILAQDPWTRVSDMPTARNAHAIETVNGKIYVFGGEQLKSKTVEEYSPTTNTWDTKTDMPTERGWLSCSVVNKKIYAIGGGDVFPPTKSYKIVEEYDPATDTWTTKTSIPVGRIAHAPHSVSIGGKIYVIGGGGILASDAYSEVYVYSPVSDRKPNNIAK